MKNELGERRHTGLKVVLDTNVYVSIFNFPDSLISEIWFHALKHHYELFLSPVIVEEFARICRRDFDWDEKSVRLHVRLLNKTGKFVVPGSSLMLSRRTRMITISSPVLSLERQTSLFLATSIF